MKTQRIIIVAGLLIFSALSLIPIRVRATTPCGGTIKFNQEYLTFNKTFSVASYYDVYENTTYSAKVQRQGALDGPPAGSFKYQIKVTGGAYGTEVTQNFPKESPNTKVVWINDSSTVCNVNNPALMEIQVQYYTITSTPAEGFKKALLKYKLGHNTSYFKTDYTRDGGEFAKQSPPTALACNGGIHVYDILDPLPTASSAYENKFRAYLDTPFRRVSKCVNNNGTYSWVSQGDLPNDSHYCQ